MEEIVSLLVWAAAGVGWLIVFAILVDLGMRRDRERERRRQTESEARGD